MKNIYVSASSLKDFVSCHRKVFYRLFKSEEGIEVPESSEAIRGKIVHQAVASYWNDYASAAAFAFSEAKRVNLPDSDRDDVILNVNNFFSYFRNVVKPGDLIEHKFKIKLSDGIYLVGVFDRVSSGLIYDWKTTKNVPSKISNDIQFIVYSNAYKTVFGENPSGLYYASLRTGRMVRYMENKDYVDAVFNEVIPAFTKAVKERTFPRTGIFNKSCYPCDYKLLCFPSGGNDVMDSTKFT